jgi:dihydrofolate reductase
LWLAGALFRGVGEVITDPIADLGALLLGRKTYEILAVYWPKQPAENPIAARLNGAPKYIVSRGYWVAAGVADELASLVERRR